MRLPYSRVRIAHVNEGKVTKDCALGESGVILVKGPQVFCGYKAASDNANAWVEDGWFNTGDLGYLDADGFVYLSGRAKDLIIRGGHNIDPALIEEALSAHPAVASAVAVGLPDAYAGELPMAFVVLHNGAQSNARELLDFCEQRISERAAIPRRIEIIPAMPLTAVGKIYKPTLRQKISEMVLREVLEEQQIDASITGCIDKQRGLVLTIRIEDAAQKSRALELLQPYALTMDFV